VREAVRIFNFAGFSRFSGSVLGRTIGLESNSAELNSAFFMSRGRGKGLQTKGIGENYVG
jgi:hypothetical protein